MFPTFAVMNYVSVDNANNQVARFKEHVNVLFNRIPATDGCRIIKIVAKPVQHSTMYHALYGVSGERKELHMVMVTHKCSARHQFFTEQDMLYTGCILYALVENGSYCWVDGYSNMKHLLNYWTITDVISRRVLVEKTGFIL